MLYLNGMITSKPLIGGYLSIKALNEVPPGFGRLVGSEVVE